MSENGLLGSPDLHGRLCLSSCILAELLRRGTDVTTGQLVQAVGHPREEVEQMCIRLVRNGLLQSDPQGEGQWRLAGNPSEISLADLFSALLAPSSLS